MPFRHRAWQLPKKQLTRRWRATMSGMGIPATTRTGSMWKAHRNDLFLGFVFRRSTGSLPELIGLGMDEIDA
jgi:hypothetical protein